MPLQMTRRQYLSRSSTLFLAASSLAPNSSQALISCLPFDQQGFQQCESGIDSRIADVTAASVGGQHMSQWCWAACIEMVFQYYGYSISQEKIVQQTWGEIINQPAKAEHILGHLNRRWVDDNGRRFSVTGDRYSANPVSASIDLSNNQPLIIGTQGHAMVLTSLLYVRDQWGRGQVRSAVVRDPWPNKGRRHLTPAEWYGTQFLARIRILPL